METIRIKCPNCGAVLRVQLKTNSPDVSLTCPNCKQKAKLSDFKKFEVNKVHDETKFGFFAVSDTLDLIPGVIVDEATKREYQLSIGVNLIGRMTLQTAPKASVPIFTKDMGMSRAHLYLEVVKGRDGLLHTYAYNAANVNPTYINGVLLEKGDKIGIKNDDKISTSQTVLIFKEECSDSDATRLKE